MDPLTQMSVGAAAAALISKRSDARLALIVGGLAGGAPDLDVLIRSDTDPLLALEYHRHFTHSLLLAPWIGFFVAGLFRLLFFWKAWPLKKLALFAILGSMTHGMIDACTSYGTLLYWPFSYHRESWDIISIIDPVFTLPLVGLLMLCFLFRKPVFALTGVLLCLAYLGLGIFQRSQAATFAVNLAEQRGHQAEELSVRPSLANIILWRIVYRSGQEYYVDAVWTLPWAEPKLYNGGVVPAYVRDDEISEHSVLFQDIDRFDFFSQGYLYQFDLDPQIVGDLRYAMFPDSTVPLWGIRVDPSRPDEHVSFEYFRDRSQGAVERLWTMVCGRAL
jgi:inner membrane protein